MKPRLPPDLAAAVGEFIVAWTAAQHIVVFAISELKLGKPIEADPAAATPLFGMDARKRLGLLHSLAKARLPPDSATRIGKLTEKMADLRDRRNDLANGLWEKQPKRGQWVVLLTKPIGKVSYARKPVSAKQVDHWRQTLYAQATRLVREMQRCGFMQDYSPNVP